MANDVSNIKIEPADVKWGNPETTKITCVADDSDDSDAEYFTMYATDGTLFYVWMDASGSAVDPAVSGGTGIEVTIATDNTAATIAGLMVTAINANANFNAKIDPNDADSFIIQNVGVGPVTAVVTDGATTSATDFTITQLRAGSSLDLGYIEGDMELSFTENVFDVLAQQSGTQILDQIRTGNAVESISIAMKESTAAKLQEMLEAGGASVTPTTKVSGWGESKRFTNRSTQARQLIFHPVRLASTVYTSDLCFWRAYPMVSGLNFSGESNQLINVEFMVYPDPLIATTVNMFAFGNHQQNLLR